jgi:hypothetical protein
MDDKTLNGIVLSIHTTILLPGLYWNSNYGPTATNRMDSGYHPWQNMLCNQMVFGLNLFLHNSNSYLLINVVPFKGVSLWLYTTSPARVFWLKAFHGIHPAILLESWWYHYISFLLTPYWISGKERSHTALNLLRTEGMKWESYCF